MKHCDACKVDVSGDLDRCPLCQAKLTGVAEPAVFPDNVVRKSGVLALSILAFATGVALLAMVFAGYLHSLPTRTVAIACIALVMNYLFVRNILVHNPDFLRIVMRYFLVILAMAFVWFLVADDLVVTTYVIPCICLLAIVFDAVLVIIFRGWFVSDFAKYLLFDMVLGIAPLALIALGLTTWNIPALGSAFAAIVFLLALLAFGRRRLVEETRKLFNS